MSRPGAGEQRDPSRPPASAGASRVAGGASCSSPGAGAFTAPVGAVAGGGGVPGQGPAAAAASPTSADGEAAPDAGPPVPVGDDGAPLSAEAAASPFSSPASERYEAFLKLVDSSIKAGLQKRHMRCADFSALAADNSLIVARLLGVQSAALVNQACAEVDPAEAESLLRRAWSVLLAQALPVLLGRLDKGTLLPGTLRKVEEAYKVHEMQTIYRMTEQPMPGVAVLQRVSRLKGYDAALHAAFTALNLLYMPTWRSEERGRAQAFVLATLRLIPKTAGLPDTVAGELPLVSVIERHMTPDRYGADFCASVLALWRSRAVVDVLGARGSLQIAASSTAATHAEFEARKLADLAKRGLRRCALPSCGKQEVTVLQFRVCGHCQTSRYCRPEHAKQHWKAHKREYEEGAE